MNTLNSKITATHLKLKSVISSEICYFQKLVHHEFSDIVRTHQEENEIRLKIYLINEDMKEYMKKSYPIMGNEFYNEKVG
jgi:hypothetical protein